MLSCRTGLTELVLLGGFASHSFWGFLQIRVNGCYIVSCIQYIKCIIPPEHNGCPKLLRKDTRSDTQTEEYKLISGDQIIAKRMMTNCSGSVPAAIKPDNGRTYSRYVWHGR